MEKVICKCGIGRGEVLDGALIDLPIQRVPGGAQAIQYKRGPGPFPCGFPNIGISQKLGFRAFLWISGRFFGDFRCPRAPEIHIFYLKFQF